MDTTPNGKQSNQAKDFAHQKNDFDDDGDGELHDDEFFDFVPVETAFEKSNASKLKNQKGGGVYGKFRGSKVVRAFSVIGSKQSKKKEQTRRNTKTVPFSGNRMRRGSDLETGNLGDESSPEFARTSRLEPSSFAFLSQKEDLDSLSEQEMKTAAVHSHNFFGSGDDRTSATSCASSLHSRSSSVDYFPPQIKPSARRSLHRSHSMATGTTNSDHGQATRRTFQRSHSLALGTTSTTTSTISNTTKHGFQSSNCLSNSAMNGAFGGENAYPNSNDNDLDAIEHCSNLPGRKKMRGRRHSCFGSTSLDRESSTSSSTGSSMVLPNTFPSELGWLNPESSPSQNGPPLGSSNFVGDSANTLSIFQSQSPSALSAASSSRKRGVCGSPVSDTGIDRDDWGLTLSGSSYCSEVRRTSRSRSRIFSPDESSIPFAPSLLAPNLFADEEQRHSSHESRRDEVMDESSDDESLFHHHSSPDSSFEITLAGKVEHCVEQERRPAEVNDDSPQAVFDTMSSLEDLKFLIRELRKESHRHKVAFGMGDMWKVAPPMKWSSKRRTEFNGWTKGHLGFQVRSAGQGYTFLQIGQHRGSQVLASLEDALIEHKKQQDETPMKQQPFGTEVCVNNDDACPSTGTLLFSSHNFASPALKASPTEQRPMSVVKPDLCSSPEDVIMDDADEDLVNKISSLSMNGPPTSSTRLLSRMVTLPQDEPRRPQQDPIFRLSLESRASSRPSLEGATDVNFHTMFGSSPRLPRGRPPKMSINSVGSFETVAGAPHRQSASPRTDAYFTETAAPINTGIFVATPLMTQQRDWGSRPIQGRDWGESVVYDETLMAELNRRFEEICRGDDPTETALFNPFENIHRSSSSLFDDLAFGGIDEDEAVVEDQRRTIERENRRRQNSINKLRRMSLFAVAAGSRPRHPRESRSTAFRNNPIIEEHEIEIDNPAEVLGKKEHLMGTVFSFLGETDLMTVASTVCTQWADWATDAHANLLLSSVPIPEADDEEEENLISVNNQREPVLERSWKSIHGQFPWACYLAAGGAKTVYRAYNILVGQEEAISVMDTHAVESMQIVANELVVSAMLSSLVRRAICPNFIAMHGVFTMANAPPPSHWGDEEEKYPSGKSFVAGKSLRKPSARKGSHPGRYQYIRMELVNEGDAEELIKRQKDERFDFDVARGLLFQIAFGIFAAADKYSVKHYDIKLLNIFVHRDPEAASGLVLRYGLGSLVFAVKMPSRDPYIAKVADFGTANTVPDSNGQPVTMAHFTTLENTPPDYMILGDDATQGHEHDNFGLGLAILHLFTGSRPYEEILEEVKCPPQLKARLRKIWENESVGGYSVIRTVISDDPFETLYHTLYRFLVLFGIPEIKFQRKTCPKVWKAISDSLESPNASQGRNGRGARKRKDSDMTQYSRDCKKFSVRNGNNKYIARARKSLMLVDGGLDLLLSMCSFDPRTRGTAMSVLNSPFMEDLREAPGTEYNDGCTVRSYMSFAIHN